MDNPTSFSVTVKPELEGDFLFPLAGRWNIGVQVKITNPANISTRTIKTISLVVLESKPASEIHNASLPVVNE